jgi:hypothetical protein
LDEPAAAALYHEGLVTGPYHLDLVLLHRGQIEEELER